MKTPQSTSFFMELTQDALSKDSPFLRCGALSLEV